MADVNTITAYGTLAQGLGTIAGAGAVAWAAWLGSSTFEAWRRQRLSERYMELAERILTATYKVRRGLSVVRCILLRAYELEDAEKILKEQGAWDAASETERRHLRQAHVYYNRLEATKDDRLALEECQPMARALFGEELEQALEKLIHQAWIVNVFASTAETKDAELQADIFDALRERYPKPEKNKMDQTIAAQVKTIEDVCLPVLRLENEKRKGSIRLSERARASRAPVSGGS